MALLPGAAAGAGPARGLQILGLDLLLDEELRPWLLEASASPRDPRQFDGKETMETSRQEK